MARSFWKSSHRKQYILLALRFLVTPKHVYLLAHNDTRCKTKKDNKIMHELHKKGIIHRSRP